MVSKIFPLFVALLLFSLMRCIIAPPVEIRNRSKQVKKNALLIIRSEDIDKHQHAMDDLIQYDFYDDGYGAWPNCGDGGGKKSAEQVNLVNSLSTFVRKTVCFVRKYRWLFFSLIFIL